MLALVARVRSSFGHGGLSVEGVSGAFAITMMPKEGACPSRRYSEIFSASLNRCYDVSVRRTDREKITNFVF